MFTRTYGLVAILGSLVVASCGSGGGNTVNNKCTPNTVSVPGMMNDPCPQTGTACAAAGMVATSMCQANGTWSLMCACTAPLSGAAGGTGGKTCGNGKIDTGEMCDPLAPMPMNLTCAAMNLGQGTVSCDAATCRPNTQMCHMMMMGGGGNGGGGHGGSGR